VGFGPLATDSFCSEPNSSAVTRNGSEEKRLPPAAAKVKPLAKHPKQPAPKPRPSTKPMVADKKIAQDLMKELEKSLTSHLSRHGGGGSKDPAAMLCEHLLNGKIMREETCPQIVASAPPSLQQTQTAVDDTRKEVDDARRTPQEQTQHCGRSQTEGLEKKDQQSCWCQRLFPAVH
jgi:hypothetical protein